MSIAEFYIENGIDPEDPEDLDRFLAAQYASSDWNDMQGTGAAGYWQQGMEPEKLDAILQRYVAARPGPFTQYDIPGEIDEVDACTADYAARAIQVMRLTEYNVQGMPVPPEGLRLLAECLRTNTSLRKLELESEECYQIGEAYKDLGDALRVNTALTELRIVHHPQATPAQEMDLIDAITANTTLTTLRLDHHLSQDLSAKGWTESGGEWHRDR